ncbi:hypothetical protein IHQ71_16070 [Rhizobium sp. TH2]|uniref:hypothetical protein n=1 Tax=Rhizobium sp. TH2 TaxID=2775403 RepID=UPI0021583E81|nr:hypothetical protein [Rhizobium sp. TH2]UVC06771.1 hypothetical protein IHQ71_16070 [Rhizobium sp. TH2]
MIYKVVFRKKAIADLEALYKYIRDREKSSLFYGGRDYERLLRSLYRPKHD